MAIRLGAEDPAVGPADADALHAAPLPRPTSSARADDLDLAVAQRLLHPPGGPSEHARGLGDSDARLWM